MTDGNHPSALSGEVGVKRITNALVMSAIVVQQKRNGAWLPVHDEGCVDNPVGDFDFSFFDKPNFLKFPHALLSQIPQAWDGVSINNSSIATKKTTSIDKSMLVA